MPRKAKKPVPVDTVQKPEVDPAYLNEQGIPTLPQAQYWRWRALTAEMEKYGLQHLKAKEDFERLVRSNPDLMNLRGLIAEAKAQNANLAQEMVKFQTEVQEATKLDLSKCAIDDKNGQITVMEFSKQDEPKED